LAYIAVYPDRVLSLAIDEPAMDFTEEGQQTYGWEAFDHALTLPDSAAMAEFMRLQVADDVELAPLPEPLPASMANSPAGVRAFLAAGRGHRVDVDAYRRYLRMPRSEGRPPDDYRSLTARIAAMERGNPM